MAGKHRGEIRGHHVLLTSRGRKHSGQVAQSMSLPPLALPRKRRPDKRYVGPANAVRFRAAPSPVPASSAGTAGSKARRPRRIAARRDVESRTFIDRREYDASFIAQPLVALGRSGAASSRGPPSPTRARRSAWLPRRPAFARVPSRRRRSRSRTSPHRRRVELEHATRNERVSGIASRCAASSTGNGGKPAHHEQRRAVGRAGLHRHGDRPAAGAPQARSTAGTSNSSSAHASAANARSGSFHAMTSPSTGS